MEVTSVGEGKERAHSGTIFYQTSFKRSQPFWLLIGVRKLLCFYAQAERMRPASRFSVKKHPGNDLTNRCSGRLFNFKGSKRRRLEDSPPIIWPPKIKTNNVLIFSNI